MTKLRLYMLLVGSLILSLVFPIHHSIRSANGIQEIIENAGEKASELQRTMISEMISTATTHINNSHNANDPSEAKFERRVANYILGGLITGLTKADNISSSIVLREVIPNLKDTKIALENARHIEAVEILRNVSSTFSNSFQ